MAKTFAFVKFHKIFMHFIVFVFPKNKKHKKKIQNTEFCAHSQLYCVQQKNTHQKKYKAKSKTKKENL